MKQAQARSNPTPLVITERSLQDTEPPQLGGLESADHGRMRELYDRARLRLKEKSDAGSSNVLITVDDQEVSLFQSSLSARALRGETLSAGGLEAKFGAGLRGGDWWGWMTSLLNWIDRGDAHPIIRPTSPKPADLGDRAKIALLSDWGTGLYGAPISAQTIKSMGGFDLLLHLGDVYYAGTVEEVKSRFLNIWPKEAGTASRALNSNHEMYSGGYGYFQNILPSLGQSSSYFAFQNQYWLLVCLDTAYVDHEIDREQIKWFKEVMAGCGHRRVIVFSHHQLFSCLASQGPKLHAALSVWLSSGKIAAWYWGHEHECMLYEPHGLYGFHARCLGNGGVPEPRKSEVTDAETVKSMAGMAWKRLPQVGENPACLVLDGRNRYVVGEEDKFGPHGFMTLELNGPTLLERVFLPDGTELFNKLIN